MGLGGLMASGVMHAGLLNPGTPGAAALAVSKQRLFVVVNKVSLYGATLTAEHVLSIHVPFKVHCGM
jgi:hypothetical protein